MAYYKNHKHQWSITKSNSIKMKTYILVVVSFFWCLDFLNAQDPSFGFNNKTKKIDEWNTYLDLRKQETLSKYKDYKFKNELERYLTERHQALINKINEGHFYFDQKIESYFQRIFNEILNNNTFLKNEKVRFLVSRYNWPNASYIGDGVIIFNIGLIEKLNYDDEIAFIICHELAHYYFEHLDNNYIASLNNFKSKETKEKIKAIKKSEFGTYTKGVTLFKGFMYDSRKHIRGHEYQADSLGLVLLENAKYNTIAARNVLYLLDTIDNTGVQKVIKLDSIFNFEEYPFQESWKSEPKQMFSTRIEKNDSWDVDSIKTHPDCLKRINALKLQYNDEHIFTVSPELEFIKKNIKYELILFECEFGDTGKCLFKALELLRDMPSDLSALSIISSSFEKIIDARKNHKSHEIIMKPSETQNDRLKELLTILSNMRSIEMANVNYYLLKNAFIKYDYLRKNEAFLKLINNAANISQKTSDFELIKNI